MDGRPFKAEGCAWRVARASQFTEARNAMYCSPIQGRPRPYLYHRPAVRRPSVAAPIHWTLTVCLVGGANPIGADSFWSVWMRGRGSGAAP